MTVPEFCMKSNFFFYPKKTKQSDPYTLQIWPVSHPELILHHSEQTATCLNKHLDCEHAEPLKKGCVCVCERKRGLMGPYANATLTKSSWAEYNTLNCASPKSSGAQPDQLLRVCFRYQDKGHQTLNDASWLQICSPEKGRGGGSDGRFACPLCKLQFSHVRAFLTSHYEGDCDRPYAISCPLCVGGRVRIHVCKS